MSMLVQGKRRAHFHNDQYDPNNRLYKLHSIYTELNEKFKLHGGLQENVSIDESMIPYYRNTMRNNSLEVTRQVWL